MPWYEEKDKPGFYYFKVNYKDENGKYKQLLRRGFKSKKEVKAAMTELQDEVNKGTFFKPTADNYQDFMQSFLQDKKMHVKPQTLKTYESMVNNHILPALGSKALAKITPRDVQSLYNKLHEKGSLSDENIQKVHTIINESMKKALSWEMINKNPVTLVERPKARKKEMQVWSLDEAKQFLNAAINDRLYIAFLLALTTGMRQGEILGLRWKDVDFKNRIISITQILNHDGKGFDVGAKTLSGQRPIKIDKETMDVLSRHQINSKKERIQYADVYQDHGLVISTRFGTPVSPRNLNRTFERLVSDLNKQLEEKRKLRQGVPEDLKKIRFHDLRHTHVTMLIKNRETPQAIAERLGWSDTRMIDNYAHIRPDIQEDVADSFGKSFYGNS